MSALLSILLSLASFGGLPAEDLELATRARSLLSDRCFSCHGPDSASRRAGLRLDQWEGLRADRRGGPAIEPGRPDLSALTARVEAENPELRMPPPESGLELSPPERELLRSWVQAGAPWVDHWAFVPPRQDPRAAYDSRDDECSTGAVGRFPTLRPIFASQRCESE